MLVGLLSNYTIWSFGKSLASNSKWPMKCISLNNQICQTRPMLVKINSHEPLHYQFTVSAN